MNAQIYNKGVMNKIKYLDLLIKNYSLYLKA